MIGKNLAQEECNWPSKFQGMDFNIIKILSVPFNKVCPPGPFLVPASLGISGLPWMAGIICGFIAWNFQFAKKPGGVEPL